MSRVYNAYIYTLRLPLHLFFLIMLSSPVLLSVIFTGLYLLDLEGLYIPQDHQPHAESLQHHHQIHKTSTSLSLWEVFYVLCGGEDRFKIFIFSLSLSTTFGGTRVEARSPYTLLLANLNTLMAQLIFVFLSGAGGLQLSLSLSSRELWHWFCLWTLTSVEWIAIWFAPSSSSSSAELSYSCVLQHNGNIECSISQVITAFRANPLVTSSTHHKRQIYWAFVQEVASWWEAPQVHTILSFFTILPFPPLHLLLTHLFFCPPWSFKALLQLASRDLQLVLFQ